jgi:hypothetical protein
LLIGSWATIEDPTIDFAIGLLQSCLHQINYQIVRDYAILNYSLAYMACTAPISVLALKHWMGWARF